MKRIRLTLGKKKEILPALQIVADSGSALGFGIQWQSTVSAKSRESAQKSAVQRGATHARFFDQQYAYCRVLPQTLAHGERLIPAAQVAARLVGTGICLIKLSANIYWVSVVRHSQPTVTDKLLSDEKQAIALATEIHGQWLKNESTSLTIHSNLDAIEELIKSAETRKLQLSTLTQSVSENEAVLSAFKKKETPKPLVVVALIASLTLIAYKGYEYYRKQQRIKEIAAAQAAQTINPELAWANAIKEWSLNTPSTLGNKSLGVRLARAEIGVTPVDIGGWILLTSSCRASKSTTASDSESNTKRRWMCSAQYKRAVPAVTSSAFNELAPKKWQLQFPNLSTALANWWFEENTLAINVDDLLKVSAHQIETASTLQPYLPALQEELILSFEPVPIEQPKDSQGAAIPRPETTPNILRSLITAKGPLRSMDALIESQTPADWQEIKITAITPYPENDMESGLKTSVITAELKGLIYAKN